MRETGHVPMTGEPVAQADGAMVIRVADVPFEVRVPAAFLGVARRVFTPYRCDDAPRFTVTPDDDPGYAAYLRDMIPQIEDAELYLDQIMHGTAAGLLDYDCLLLHAAVVAVDGRAYAFSAPSGTGKSTHVSLWRRHFGDRAVIVNGDKPFLRRVDGAWLACASPWAGKENWQTRVNVPLDGVCFVERGERDAIRPLSAREVTDRIVAQIDPALDVARVDRQLRLIDRLISEVPCYLLACTVSPEAARLSYETLSGKEDWDDESQA